MMQRQFPLMQLFNSLSTLLRISSSYQLSFAWLGCWPGLAIWPIRRGRANKQRNESDCKSFAQAAASLTLKICQVLFANCNGMWQVGVEGGRGDKRGKTAARTKNLQFQCQAECHRHRQRRSHRYRQRQR